MENDGEETLRYAEWKVEQAMSLCWTDISKRNNCIQQLLAVLTPLEKDQFTNANGSGNSQIVYMNELKRNKRLCVISFKEATKIIPFSARHSLEVV